MADESRTAVAAAFLGNAALATFKGVAAAVTGSAGLLTETFHSIADTGNQVLLFVGMRLARRPRDARHPFGHGSDVYFWSFVVSAMLFSVGGGFAIWEAVRTFLHPAAHESFFWGYVTLAGAFVFESASFAIAFRGRAAVHRRATAGLTLTQRTGDPRWDGAASACIGVILIAVAAFLAYDNYSLLIGESATDDVESRIRRLVRTDPDVAGLVSLHTMHLGPDALLIAVGVHFRPQLTATQVEDAAQRLQVKIQAGLEHVTEPHLIFIEPTPPAGTPARDAVERRIRDDPS